MILYFGNKKSGDRNPTTVDLLAPVLSEKYEVVSASSVQNIPLRMVHMALTLVRYSRKAKLILIDTYSTKAFWYTYVLSLLARFFKIKYMPVLHGGNLPGRLDRSKAMSQAIFKNAFYNISPSTYLKKEFEDRGFKVFYLPNSIPVDQYEFEHRQIVGPRLLSVRAFDKIYNIPMSVRVLNELTKDYPGAELCIVGPDKDGTQAVVEKMINELKLEKHVRITGKLSKPEWHELSKGYDIFISTTNLDNMPVSVIEAMALGLPVVSTAAGGIPYLLTNGETGMVVPINDHLAMTAALKALISDKALASALSANARKKVENFDDKIVMRQWFSLLDQALAHPPGRAFEPRSIPEFSAENS